MAFYHVCEHCQSRMKVPKSVGGQEIRCFACRQKTKVASFASRDEQSLMEQGVQDLVPGFIRRTYNILEPIFESFAPPFNPPPLVYLLFVVLLLPLLVFSGRQNEFQKRLTEIIETNAKAVSPYAHAEVDLEKIAAQYPEHKIPGALLPRETKVYWFYGAVAWFGTLTFILLVFPRGTASLLQLSTVAFFTATVGVAGLLFLQLLAMASFGTVGMFGPMFVVVTILKIFAIAYICAFLPGVSFWASLFGFVVGVGICEEFFKALPFLSQAKHMHKTSWQTVCIWGLASGMGFGVAEALYYSVRFYNGYAPGYMYVMRFTSCVAIHATLTAAAALLFYRYDRLISNKSMVSWLAVVIMALAPSAILHGLYDTLLKHQMAPAALFVSILSFLWMTLQIELANSRSVAAELETENVPEEAPSAALTQIIGLNEAASLETRKVPAPSKASISEEDFAQSISSEPEGAEPESPMVEGTARSDATDPSQS